MKDDYYLWLDDRIAKNEQEIAKREQQEDTPALLRRALMMRRALGDARRYGSVAGRYRKIADEVRALLDRELQRGQLSPVLYSKVMECLDRERSLRRE